MVAENPEEKAFMAIITQIQYKIVRFKNITDYIN